VRLKLPKSPRIRKFQAGFIKNYVTPSRSFLPDQYYRFFNRGNNRQFF
jgi:hypothetical protein